MEKRGVRFEERDDGVYVVVDPTADLQLPELLELVRAQGLDGYEEEALGQALGDRRGKLVRVLEKGEEPQPAEFLVRVSDDFMKAEIYLEPPKGGASWPTEEEIRAFLASEKIVFGVRDDVLSSLTSPGSERRWLVVAEGTPAIDGKDGQLVFKVESAQTRDLEAARVDLRDMGTIINITRGTEIVEKIPPTEAVDGTDVMGRTVKARRGRDPRIPAGANVRLSEDGLRLYADADGHLSLKEERISVLPLFEVPGDVDFSVGNIDFLGSVEIKGTVREDFVVKAGGDIIVKGVVEGATLESKGEMIIQIGVRGMGKAKLICRGNLKAGYLDQCHIQCDHDVIVEKGALRHSQISCRGKVIVSSDKKGQIVGGKIQAGTEVRCVSLGSEMGTKTQVAVGFIPELVEERKAQAEAAKELDVKLQEIKNNISFLKKLEEKGNLDDSRRALLVKLTKARFQIEAQQSVVNSRLEVLDGEIEKCRHEGVVRVRGTCYPGVTVSIRGVAYVVREEMKFVRFILDQGEVRVLPFS
ncbi:MAG: DUF342 domain-containing protein [Synergistaceae bacterium]|nr:DUF342 domain-containing protein [Synergistaceae bacterium]